MACPLILASQTRSYCHLARHRHTHRNRLVLGTMMLTTEDGDRAQSRRCRGIKVQQGRGDVPVYFRRLSCRGTDLLLRRVSETWSNTFGLIFSDERLTNLPVKIQPQNYGGIP
ncbi:hypothetical protein IF2G_06355 [Cordyceps javanica]|nr:hypothetical protein IF2G_06355 [Cordyceps javanica]